ncbi:MAG TPA: hypothetical protein VI585_19260 [Candidatus Binatia bacterium]
MQSLPDARAALVIAHPGHELRVHRWLEVARPLVFVLTDGSGRSGLSRLNSTTKILSQAGAQVGSIFGRFTDAETYTAILQTDFGRFTDVAIELAENFRQKGVEYVAGDASEGYNPAHDLCRLVLNAAVKLVNRHTGKHLRNFDFPLTGRPDNCHHKLLKDAIRLDLDDSAFARKVTIAQSYPELLQEVASTVSENGIDAFRRECLRPVCELEERYILEGRPFYERYGERQVAAGVYSKVLRYRQHMFPLAEALQRHVERMDGQ